MHVAFKKELVIVCGPTLKSQRSHLLEQAQTFFQLFALILCSSFIAPANVSEREAVADLTAGQVLPFVAWLLALCRVASFIALVGR